jgi:hypothetical protein
MQKVPTNTVSCFGCKSSNKYCLIYIGCQKFQRLLSPVLDVKVPYNTVSCIESKSSNKNYLKYWMPKVPANIVSCIGCKKFLPILYHVSDLKSFKFIHWTHGGHFLLLIHGLPNSTSAVSPPAQDNYDVAGVSIPPMTPISLMAFFHPSVSRSQSTLCIIPVVDIRFYILQYGGGGGGMDALQFRIPFL